MPRTPSARLCSPPHTNESRRRALCCREIPLFHSVARDKLAGTYVQVCSIFRRLMHHRIQQCKARPTYTLTEPGRENVYSKRLLMSDTIRTYIINTIILHGLTLGKKIRFRLMTTKMKTGISNLSSRETRLLWLQYHQKRFLGDGVDPSGLCADSLRVRRVRLTKATTILLWGQSARRA